jgi:hypothetical protein
VAKLALVVTQVAEARRVVGAPRRRRHPRPCQLTPPPPGSQRMRPGPKVACGPRHGKSQQAREY